MELRLELEDGATEADTSLGTVDSLLGARVPSINVGVHGETLKEIRLFDSGRCGPATLQPFLNTWPFCCRHHRSTAAPPRCVGGLRSQRTCL